MKQFLGSGLLSAAVAVALLTAPVQAQTCSEELEGGLLSCIDNAISSCDSAVSECTAEDVAVSLQDIEDAAIEQCCSKTGKTAKKATKKRKNCLKKLRRKYKGLRTTPLFDLVRDGKQIVKGLISSDCNGNAYAQVF